MTRKFISKDDLLKFLPAPHGEAECDYHERIIEIIYDMDTISVDDGIHEDCDTAKANAYDRIYGEHKLINDPR